MSTSAKDKAKLTDIYGEVVFEIFKFLSFRHLLSTAVLVSRHWYEVVHECCSELDVSRDSFVRWKGNPLKKQQDSRVDNSSATAAHPVDMGRIVNFVQRFPNLKTLYMQDWKENMELRHFIEMISHPDMTSLSEITLVRCYLLRSLQVEEVRVPVESTTTTTTTTTTTETKTETETRKRRSFFSRLFYKDSPPQNKSPSDENDKAFKIEQRITTLVPVFPTVPASITKLTLFDSKLIDSDLTQLLKMMPDLKSLSLKFNLSLSNPVIHGNGSLTHLEFDGGKTRLLGVTLDVSLGQSLTHLTLIDVPVQVSQLYDFLSSQVCSKIEHIHLQGGSFPNLVTRDYNGTSAPVVHFNTNKHSTCKSLLLWGPGTLDEIAWDYFPFVETLSLNHITSDIVTFAKHKPDRLSNLKQLTINFVVAELDTLARKSSLTHLRYLPKKNTTSNTPILSFANLEELNIAEDSISDDEVNKMVSASPNLKILILRLLKLQSAPTLTQSLSQLTVLDLSYHHALDDAHLSRIVAHTVHLEVLNLKMCKNIKSPSISLKRLKVLAMGGTEIIDYALEQILHECPAIKQLSINCCLKLAVPQLSGDIQYLDMSENPNMITSQTIGTLIGKLLALRSLVLRWCDKFTLEQQDVQIFRNIMYLDVTGCQSVDLEFIQSFKKMDYDKQLIARNNELKLFTPLKSRVTGFMHSFQ